MIHPETGEVLDTREQFQAALAGQDDKLSHRYRLRRMIQEAYAEKFEAAGQPPARSRTPTQDRVARCPRCGMKLEASNGA